MASPSLRLRIYVLVLTAGAVTELSWIGFSRAGLDHEVLPWLFLVGLLTLSESADLSFHARSGRWGLSAADAIFMPLLVGFTIQQAALGAGIAIAVAQATRWRIGVEKILFNVAQYVLAASAAAGVYHALVVEERGFSVRNAAAAVVSVFLFALLTHVAVAIGKSLVGLGRFSELLAEVAPAALWNVAGNVTLGLFFAASYQAESWTVLLFPAALGALYLGYRAVLAQSGERERATALHAASRALAASPDLEHAIRGFLDAVREIVSADDALVLVRTRQGLCAWSAGAGGSDKRDVAGDSALAGLIDRFRDSAEPVMLADGDDLLEELTARDGLAAPLDDDGHINGALVVLNRTGAEEFGSHEMTLLDALANELVLTLDSYRLFEQVREERERFQRIFEGSKEGIALLDEHGVVHAWNPALQSITGYSQEEMLEHVWSERIVIRNEEHQRIGGMGIVAISSEEELEVVTKNGPSRWVSVLSGPIQTGDERGWVVIVRDITAIHEVEEAKSDFLSTISHELRTPLTTIKGSLQMLSRPTAGVQSDVGKQMVEIMRRGADRLERLVMNLLTVSQMETGTLQVFPDEMLLEDLVRARAASVLIDHPQVEIEAQEGVRVRADKERMGQVVEHLMDNARKFGGPEGKITVRIAQDQGFAHLTVTDEGPGIPKTDQERVFERFVRLGHLLTRETQGAGVGLFIAKRAVDAMGGSIWVESEPGLGSTFHVRVPLARPVAVSEPASTA